MSTRNTGRKPPPEPRLSKAAAPDRWPLHVLALFLLACGVYANSLGNGFVTDDRLQLLKNPLVMDFRHIPAIFFRAA